MEDSEIYVDSEEDEIFFGCINEKEQKFCSKLTKFSGWNLPSKGLLNNNIDVEEKENNRNFFSKNTENCMINQEDEICPGLLKDDALNTSVGLENDLSSIIDNEEAYYSINSNNVSIELDHNYSYMKQKIDKSILATPKSVVKADKDGGFLKVLSEIALVKAEADNRSGDKKDDEDKENKIVCIPEIRVTEATPEKPTKLSPSQKINMPFRRFKIIYNSPKCSDNFDFKQRPKARSFTETSENNNNNIYKRLDKEDINNSCYAETENKVNIIKKSKRHSLPNSMDFCNTTVDLTDFKSDSSALKDKINIEFSDSLKIGASEKNELQVENKISDSEILANKELTSKSEEEPINCFLNDPKTIRMDEAGDVKENSLVVNKPLLANHSLTCASSEKSKSCLMHTNLEVNNGLQNTENDDEHMKTKMQENFNSSEALTLDTTKSSNAVLSPEQVSKHNNIPPNYRFSKEARKIVEALKSSAFDDTLNFTIPEIDLEDIEDSFTTPKPSKSIPSLDQTIDDNNMLVSDIKPQGKNVVNRTKPWKTVPKDYNNKPNPSKCADKVEPLKYFSDRKMQTGMTSQVKKCVKKLPYDEKALVGTKGEQSSEKKIGFISSKIPVSNIKACRLPGSTNTEPTTMKMTPFKIPPGKTYKNPKFKNVASPINAYIHNKPTALVVNVKPQNKNDVLLKALNNKININSNKNLEKTPSKDLKLPFVEYRSATPFKVEKYPESRLPRLAPTVQKLIGSNSPRVLAHKGRFFVKTPPAKSTILSNDSTIVADPNEVSVMVCQVAQKSNTMK